MYSTHPWNATSFTIELRRRTVDQGCGDYYYDKCPHPAASAQGAPHEERTCNKWIWEKPTGYLKAFKSYRCGQEFRRCMGHKRDHNPYVIGSSAHSDEADSGTPPVASTTPTTPVMHACGVHETTVSGDHSWVYRECPSGHAHYACDGSNHSVQATCLETNANGDSCTVTGFYACQTHTH